MSESNNGANSSTHLCATAAQTKTQNPLYYYIVFKVVWTTMGPSVQITVAVLGKESRREERQTSLLLCKD